MTSSRWGYTGAAITPHGIAAPVWLCHDPKERYAWGQERRPLFCWSAPSQSLAAARGRPSRSRTPTLVGHPCLPRRRPQRLLNQALFDALIIRDEDIADAKATNWVTEIHNLAGSRLGYQESPNNNPDPAFGGQGFNKTKMVQSRVQRPNLDGLLEDLMESVARGVRRRVVEAINRTDC